MLLPFSRVIDCMSKNYELTYAKTLVIEGKVLDEDDVEGLDEIIRDLEHTVAASNIKVEVRWGKNWTGTQHGFNVYPKFTIFFNTSSFSSDDLYHFNKQHSVEDWEVTWETINETKKNLIALGITRSPALKVTLEL